MTIQGAISQLVALNENSMMPRIFNPYLEKIIETVSDYVETSAERWTPVTERLPKEGNRYIIYHESYGIRIDTRIKDEWETYGNETVLAWMPLPEAFEGAD